MQYGTDVTTGEVDYDDIARLAKEHRPKMIVAGFSAYSRRLTGKAGAIADSVGAYLLVDMAHVAGLVAAGEYPSPVTYADVVTSTTHKTLAVLEVASFWRVRILRSKTELGAFSRKPGWAADACDRC